MALFRVFEYITFTDSQAFAQGVAAGKEQEHERICKEDGDQLNSPLCRRAATVAACGYARSALAVAHETLHQKSLFGNSGLDQQITVLHASKYGKRCFVCNTRKIHDNFSGALSGILVEIGKSIPGRPWPTETEVSTCANGHWKTLRWRRS